MAVNGLDTSVLLGFYQAQRNASPSALAAGNAEGSDAEQVPQVTAEVVAASIDRALLRYEAFGG